MSVAKLRAARRRAGSARLGTIVTFFLVASAAKPNVVLVVLDDLKPLDNELSITPTLDSLRRLGTSFDNAHSQMSICGPSRASFLTSIRPDTLKIHSHVRNILHNRRAGRPKNTVRTIPEILKTSGYNTFGVGKIYHENENLEMQAVDSWSSPVHSWIASNAFPFYVREPSFPKPYFGDWIHKETERNDTELTDGKITEIAIDLLTRAKRLDAPYFVAVGYHATHLPWRAPQRFFDMYRGFNKKNWRVHHVSAPKGTSTGAYQMQRGPSCREARAYNGPVLNNRAASKSQQKSAVLAYFASASFVDAQLGILIKHVDFDNTLLIIMGDHGFHIGDKAMFCKHTNFEQGTRTPLIVVPPNADKKSIKKISHAPVELIDVLPTVADYANIDLNKAYPARMGVSLRPIVEKRATYVRGCAISVYSRGSGDSKMLGFSFKFVSHRYTVWIPVDHSAYLKGRVLRPAFRRTIEELYKYDDNDGYETINYANYGSDRFNTLRAVRRYVFGTSKRDRKRTTDQRMRRFVSLAPWDVDRLETASKSKVWAAYP